MPVNRLSQRRVQHRGKYLKGGQSPLRRRSRRAFGGNDHDVTDRKQITVDASVRRDKVTRRNAIGSSYRVARVARLDNVAPRSRTLCLC
jgi:hypothetical protein